MSLSLQTRGKKHSHIGLPDLLSNREIIYMERICMEIMLKAPRIMTKAPRIMLEPLRIIAKPPRITLEPLRIDKMPFDQYLCQPWLSIKENQR